MNLRQYEIGFGTSRMILNSYNSFDRDIYDIIHDPVNKYKHLSRKQRKRALIKEKLDHHNDW